MSADRSRLVDTLRGRATALGFDAFGIAPAGERPELGERLAHALERGWHGDMDWMAQTASRRASPRALWPEARSIVMVGINHGPGDDPMARLADPGLANISVYARRRDYHEVVKGKLKELAGLLARRSGGQVKVFVDTAPVMEKPLAEQAGLGWQGKHTVLVSRSFGSWLFLGAIYTDIELPASVPHQESCGRCTRCLDVCPTDAFPAPFQLDASRCLAYYSVEHKGQIPLAFRQPMGNRVFGCDDCLAVCPWNKFASTAREARLQVREDLSQTTIADMLALDDQGFRTLFAGTPVRRLGWVRFMRNCLVVAGNSGDRTLADTVASFIDHQEPMLRGMAAWALGRLDAERAARHAPVALARETDSEVRAEWLQ